MPDDALDKAQDHARDADRALDRANEQAAFADPVRQVTERALRRLGFAVELATDGQAAVEQFAASADRYVLVVLDLTMPGMDGLEVLRRLREAENQTPILITSARDAIGQRVEGLSLGADDYLVKPFALEELVAHVVVHELGHHFGWSDEEMDVMNEDEG